MARNSNPTIKTEWQFMPLFMAAYADILPVQQTNGNQTMLKREAIAIIGGLSKPGKMPCKSIGLPARTHCNVGAKLAKVKGSVCEKCYASKGMYTFAVVKTAQHKRLENIDSPEWIDAMVTMLKTEKFFRWHDSGDIQGQPHLDKILEIIRQTPKTKHWIPTHEKGLILRNLESIRKLKNLTVRLSGAMIDGETPIVPAGLYTSTVYTDKPQGFACKAQKQNGECKTCRACWNGKKYPDVSYPKH